MVKLKKLGIVLTSTAFSLGVLSPVAQASFSTNEPTGKIEIQVAATETKVTKNELIKKVRTLFPTEFNFLTDNDFQIGRGHFYSDDETVRHRLEFEKVVDGKNIYGSFSFKGDNLELESFNYQPTNVTDALFPAKISKDEAQKIAQNFLKKFSNTTNYQLQENGFYDDYYMNSRLTEPVRYAFSYLPTQNGIPISDQSFEISVLGNGVIDGMYRNASTMNNATFDGLEQKKSETNILQQMRDNVAVELRYNIDYDFESDEREVKLVYVPTSSWSGVHALTGQWQTLNGFSTQAPKAQPLEKLATQPLAPKKNGLTAEEAEELAKALLKVNPDKAKLVIETVEERENEDGEAVYSVYYMYQYGSGSSGTTLEINKQTGEITQFHAIDRDFTSINKETSGITKEAAQAKAIEYLKEWAPSYLHHYAKSKEGYYFDKYSKSHHFSFPRVVNGITVAGDEINVTIGADGSLSSLMVGYQNIANWPSTSKIITPDVAKASFSEALKTKLQYVKQDSKDKQHYDLVYAPTYDGVLLNQLDATTGEWLNSIKPESDTEIINHPTASKELNYLLNQRILDVKDPANFNADKSVTKGEALKIIMKSLTYVYSGGPMSEGEAPQSFPNIDPKHPLYATVEQAVRMGVLELSDDFNVEDPLTRQEFAEWSIRVLDLEKAIQNSDIYKLNFVDASSIQPAYAGYVALANGMGLLDAQDNKINATGNVTYAELAVSTIRLAHAVYEKNEDRYYW